MFCKKCGAPINPGEKFCTNCGTSVEEVVSTEETNIPLQQVQPTNLIPPANPQPMMQQSNKKKNDLTFIIVVIVVGLALIAIPIIMSGGKEEREKVDIPSNSNYSNISSDYINSNSNYYNSNFHGYNTNTNTNSGSHHNSNTNSYGQNTKIGNYTFLLPINAEVEIEDGMITFDHLRNEFDFGFLSIQEGNYEELKTSKSMLQQYFQATTNEFSVGNVSVNTYNGVEFITIPITQNGMSMIGGFAKLSDTEIVMAIVMSIDEMSYSVKADYTLFNEMAAIIKTAKRDGATGM